MEKILMQTLAEELRGLRAQLSLVEEQAQRIAETIDAIEARMEELTAQEEDTPIDTPEDDLPEVEVEFYVDDSVAADDELLSEEEQQVEETIEDVLISEIEKPEADEPEPKTEEPAPQPAPQPSQHKETAGVNMPPIDDIRKAVSIGDRFLFQRELFGGDGEKMNKTIDALNALGSLDEAMEYIDKRFAWDKDSQAYELFTNILRRRY